MYLLCDFIEFSQTTSVVTNNNDTVERKKIPPFIKNATIGAIEGGLVGGVVDPVYSFVLRRKKGTSLSKGFARAGKSIKYRAKTGRLLGDVGKGAVIGGTLSTILPSVLFKPKKPDISNNITTNDKNKV